MRDGIEVFKLSRQPETGEEEKETIGKSAKAGQMAVMQSAASRVFTNVSVCLGTSKYSADEAERLQSYLDHPSNGHDLAREAWRLCWPAWPPPLEPDEPDLE